MSSNKQSFKDLQVKYTDFVPSNLKFTKMTAGAKGLISYIDYVSTFDRWNRNHVVGLHCDNNYPARSITSIIKKR
jgi:hypothetical protein